MRSFCQSISSDPNDTLNMRATATQDSQLPKSAHAAARQVEAMVGQLHVMLIQAFYGKHLSRTLLELEQIVSLA